MARVIHSIRRVRQCACAVYEEAHSCYIILMWVFRTTVDSRLDVDSARNTPLSLLEQLILCIIEYKSTAKRPEGGVISHE